ncbi:MAG: PAS domain S-box protein [Ornithinimicrobium sp.]
MNVHSGHEGSFRAEGVTAAATSTDSLPADRSAAIVHASLDCIVTIDQQGLVVEFNPASELLFGWSREEALGRRLEDLFIPPELAQAHRDGIATYLRTGEGPVLNQRLELPAVCRDGTRLVVELIVVPTMHDDRREFTGFIRNITELRRTQELLRSSQARYEAIVRHSTKALIQCGVDKMCTFLAGEGMLGYPAQTPLEGGFLILVHPDDQQAALGFLTEVRAGTRQPHESRDLRLRRADGTYLVCEVIAEDLSDVPEVGALLVRAADVTEDRERQRKLADATAQMRTLIDHLGSAVLLEDATRHVLVANDALVELFGFPMTADELFGTDCSMAAHAIKDFFADPDGFVVGVEQLLADRESVLGEHLATADGRTLERDYFAIRSGGRHAGHLWVYRDITQRIAENVMLADQNRSLAQLAALKNEFVATVSHELRTPLTSVVSFAEMLRDPRSGPLTVAQDSLLVVIDRNSQRLLRLIDDLLLVAKLESHTLPIFLGLVDLPDLVRQVVTEQQPTAAQKDVALDVRSTAGPRVRGDSVRLQQVFSNVVGNAVKYTPCGGSVVVTCDVQEADGFWLVSVADTGVGIPPEEVPHVFDAFFRASSAAGGAAGTGLGLSITRLIVDEHHGSVIVESQPGVGTTMSVRLPFEDA